MEKGMVKELSLGLMGKIMQENSRMGNLMAMGDSLGQMGYSMMVNGRKENGMVKEHKLGQMEESMLENTRMVKLGTEQDTTRTETSK